MATNYSNSKIWGEIKFPPEVKPELTTLGAGCYWGTEKFYAKDFNAKHPDSILGTKVGFMSTKPSDVEPTYRSVCSGTTPYVEVAHILFDSNKVSFEEMAKFFFTFHDPTTFEYQGNDRGPQYSSVIFYHGNQQKETSKSVIKSAQQLLDTGKVKFDRH